MAKFTKKTAQKLTLILGLVLLIPALAYLLINIPLIQTLIVNKVTHELSAELNASVSVDRVELRLLNKLKIDGILIKEMDNDTLFFAETASATIRRIDPRKDVYILGTVKISNPNLFLSKDSSEETVFLDFINGLKAKTLSLEKERKASLTINNFDIIDGKLSLQGKADSSKTGLIDFNCLDVYDINCNLGGLFFNDSSTVFDIYRLSLNERCGFGISNLSTSAQIVGNEIDFSPTRIQLQKSDIYIPKISIKGDSITGFNDFINKVGIDITLDQSDIYSTDLGCLIKNADKTDESAIISGRIYGTISELRGREIKVYFRDYSSMDIDLDISGLPSLPNSFIFARINKLTANANDLDKIMVDNRKLMTLPEIAYNVGTATFDGRFSGFLTDFVAYGRLTSTRGIINTDISVKPDGANGLEINGLVKGTDLALGFLTGRPDLLGEISLSAELDGTLNNIDDYSGKLTGTVDGIEFNSYTYKNITFDGTFNEHTWDGHVDISEDNIKFDLLGVLDFDKELPEFNFSFNLENANLKGLNINKIDSIASVSLLLTANFKGNNLDNLDGEVDLYNTNLLLNDKILNVKTLSIISSTNDSLNRLALRNDYIDADLSGSYNSNEVVNIFKILLNNLFPSKFSYKATTDNYSDNNFIFDIRFKNTDKLNDFLKTGIRLSENSVMNGWFRQDSLFEIRGNTDIITYSNFVFKKFSFVANIAPRGIELNVDGEQIDLPWQSTLNNLNIDIKTKPDTIGIELDWDNHTEKPNKGSFIAHSILLPTSEKNRPKLVMEIEPSELFLNGNYWKISGTSIAIDSTSFNIDQLNIDNREKYYHLNGTISENIADTLYFDFNGIDISPVNRFIKNKNVNIKNPPELNLKGLIGGNILLTDIYKSPLVESDLSVFNFTIFDSEYGNIEIESEWNNQKRQLDISGSNNLLGTKQLDINGHYDPSGKYIDIDFTATHLPVSLLNSLLRTFASGITGTATGKLNLSGNLNTLALDGSLLAEKTKMKIDFLNTIYTVNDTIRFDKRGIYLNNLGAVDEKGNIGTIDGAVYHDYFKRFSVELTIDANNTMVLNTKAKDNEFIYGNIFASGVTTIKGDETMASFDISAQTGRNTQVFIPLKSTEQTLSQNSFISFVNKNDLVDKQNTAENLQGYLKPANINMNLDLTVTPDAEIQLIFDSKTGDVMKSTGSSNMNINYSANGDLEITGEYLINEGSYLFTLGNLLNKSFTVEEGGTINFNGDLDNTELDLKAIYSVRASLFDILRDEKFNERIPVECQLIITGNLTNPVIEIGIYLPDADEETRSYLNSVISTDEELSRQFVYLLVMNSFYAGPGTNATTTSGSALSVTTTEMLFNQVGNWLSQISNDFDIGFLYTPGYNNINAQEFQVALSTQLLDNKITINSDLGYRGSDVTSSGNEQITGDFDIEYKITEKIRLKAFNRFNNPYQGRQADYTQGVGVFYRQEFNKISDLFRRKKKKISNSE